MTLATSIVRQKGRTEDAPKALGLPGLVIGPPAPESVPLPRPAPPSPAYWHGSQVSEELLRAIDVAVAATLLLAAFTLTNSEQIQGGLDDFLLVRLSPKNLALFVGFLVVWPFLFSLCGLYAPRPLGARKQEIRRVVGACSLGSLATLPFLLTTTGAFQIRTVLLFWLGVVGATVLTRLLLPLRIQTLQSAGERRVLIVGSGPRALDLHRRLTSEPNGTTVLEGFVDSSPGLLDEIGHQPLGDLDDLEELLMRRSVDEVLIALPIKSCYAQIQSVIDTCERVGVEARYLADVFKHSLGRPRYESASAVPVISLKVAPDDLRLLVKRAVDVVVSAILLVMLLPVLLLVAAAIRLNSPGPVIFTQHRYGYNRRLFRMYKFRTMVLDAEAQQDALEHLNEATGPAFKIREDPRVTSVGRFLRRTSLDELPQLLNVLKGEMSLVGPRPLPTRDVLRFSEPWLMRRFSMVPGCTCLWQISGRSDLGFNDWVHLDLRYIDQWSLGLDLKILLQTIPAVLRGTGAS